jgi:hypothetical protein
MKYTTPDYELEIVETENILGKSYFVYGDGYSVFHDPDNDRAEVTVPNVSILI